MYLLVIVTLVIGLIGIYAQVLTLQAERFAAAQTGLAQTMIAWHSAAVSMAASVLDHPSGAPPLTLPCSLTVFTISAALSPCAPPTVPPAPLVGGIPSAVTGTVTGGAPSYIPNSIYNKNSQLEAVHLPPGYQTATGTNGIPYQFYSILYDDATSGKPLVVTYVNPSVPSLNNPAPSFLVLASGAPVGFSMNDLMHQLSISGLPIYAYGTVDGSNQFVRAGIQPISMPGTYVPQGSAVIISSPAGF